MKMITYFKQKSVLSEDFVEWIKKVNIVGIILILPMWVGLSVDRIILKRILKEPKNCNTYNGRKKEKRKTT
jgi:hypothetical protein